MSVLKMNIGDDMVFNINGPIQDRFQYPWGSTNSGKYVRHSEYRI